MTRPTTFAVGVAVGALLCLVVAASALHAQGVCDSTRVRRYTDSLRIEASRPNNLAPRRTFVRRYANQIDSACVHVITPAPAPAVTITLAISGTSPAGLPYSTLYVRPGQPYGLFVTARVDSAGATLSDSARFTSSDTTIAKFFWNRTARRLEVYDATRAGAITVTARYGTATATLTIPIATPTPIPTSPVTIDTTRFTVPVDSVGVWLSRDTLVVLPDTTTGCALVRAAGRWYLASTAVKVYAQQASATQYRYTAGLQPAPSHCRYVTTARGVALDSLFPVQWVVDSVGAVGPGGQFETREALGARAGYRRALAPFRRAR